MPTYQLNPVDESAVGENDFPILEKPPDAENIIEGVGDTSYECGQCSETIVKNIKKGEVQDLGFRCPECNALLYLPDH